LLYKGDDLGRIDIAASPVSNSPHESFDAH